MDLVIRKLAHYTETIYEEGGKKLEKPIKIAAAMVVIKNPLAGKPFVQDLTEFTDSLCSPIGELLAKEATTLLGGPVEAFGKGALVGTNGEVEHGSAIIHNLKFGNHLRKLAEGESLLPSAEKRGATGAPIDIALKHKNDTKIRSHHQTFEIRVPDAPLPDEIVISLAVSSGGRPHQRSGSLKDQL